MKRIASISLLLLLAFTVFTSSGKKKATKPLEEIKFQLGWYHQAQWAGFYAAEQQGYYADGGLSVSLLPRPAPKTDTIGLVVDGKADFGSTNGVSLINARSQGRHITAIASIYRRDPIVFMTLPESGITRPHDFPGRTIRALSPMGNGVTFRAMMGRLGLDPDSVRQVDAGYDMKPFYTGEVDIWPGFLTDEVLSAREKGYQVNVILPGYYGIHLYGMNIFTTGRLIKDNPDLVERFLRATLNGWRWAIENPEEAGLLALKYNSKLDREHEIAMMQASIPLIHTCEDQIGWMRAEVWKQTHDILLEQGILEGPLKVNSIYTMEFLHRIYGEE